MKAFSATRPAVRADGADRNRNGAPPWRVLLLLAALVILAHAAVLRLAPPQFALQAHDAPKPVPALSIRSIAAPMDTAAPEPARTPKPRPRPKPPPRPASPMPDPPEPLESPEPADPVAAQSAPQLEPLMTTPGGGWPAASLAPSPSGPDAASSTAASPEATALTETPPLPQAAASAAPPRPAPTQVSAIALPRSAVLSYKMNGQAKGLTYYASAELRWRNGGENYDASMRVSALFLGSRSMASTGLLGPAGLAPQRFTDKSRNEVAAHFETGKGLVTFSANTPSAPWVEGAQDRVTVFLQLGGMLAADPAAFAQGTSISIYTIGPRSADMWTFQVEGEELLKLPYGELAAVKVIRQPRREFDQRVEIWYAPALGWLPVRNRITQSNGDFVDQQLTGLE